MPENGQKTTNGDRIVLGLSTMALAIFLLSTLDAGVKWLTGAYSLVQIIFFRNLFGMLPTLVLVRQNGGLASLYTRRPLIHLLRLGLGLSMAFSFFWALSNMELADATAVFFTVPLFIALLSVIVLGERVGIRRWSAIAIGFAGALIIIRPGSGVFNPAALMVLVTSISYACMMISNRALRHTESPAALSFYPTIGALLITAALLPFAWTTPPLLDLLILAGVGILGGCGQILLVIAFRNAPAAGMAPLEYSTLLWATAYGFLIWRDLPDMLTITGAAIVAAGGLYLIYHEVNK
ncbi:MAG: DMT family transporter [Rhodospirillales bacterium]|nr:DMT family transporter [Rhodospirillales bacterium]